MEAMGAMKELITGQKTIFQLDVRRSQIRRYGQIQSDTERPRESV